MSLSLEPLTEAYDSICPVPSSDIRLAASAMSLPLPPRSHEKDSAGGIDRGTPRFEDNNSIGLI